MITNLRIAIIGAGPAGCYVVEQLQKQNLDCSIDLFDQSPFPYGLIRTGIAPDHIKMKNLAAYFEKVLTKMPLRFFGNIRIGEDISIDEIKALYSVLFICTGASVDKALPISFNSDKLYSGSSKFVKWYNGHLRTKVNWESFGSKVAVLGIGNVALDIARILLKKRSLLEGTEIPVTALDFIEKSDVKELHFFIRRGPSQMACTIHEFKELLDLETISVHCHDDFLLIPDDHYGLEESSSDWRKILVLKEALLTKKEAKEKQLHFHFYQTLHAVELLNNRLKLTMEQTRIDQYGDDTHVLGTQQYHVYDASFLVSSFGYKGEAIPGLPFDEKNGIIPHQQGRVSSWVYTSGWIKRGSQGVVGSNRSDAKESVESFLADLASQPYPVVESGDILDTLKQKKIKYFTLSDWFVIDRLEKERGAQEGKIRKEFKSVEELLTIQELNK